MLRTYYHVVNNLFTNAMSNYIDSVNFINKHWNDKYDDISPALIAMSTRKKLFKEILELIQKCNKLQPININKFLKLRKLHIKQLSALEDRSLKKNRIYFSKIESLLRKNKIITSDNYNYKI